MSNEQTCKTPLEDLRKDALAHYEEASSAISHWSSFVRDAIKAYNPTPPPVQSDSGVEEVIKEISKKYHDCTCGEIYLSRKLTAPDCLLCNADFESVAIEYASLKTKELREALEEIIEAGKDFDWGKEFWAVKIATKALNNNQ